MYEKYLHFIKVIKSSKLIFSQRYKNCAIILSSIEKLQCRNKILKVTINYLQVSHFQIVTTANVTIYVTNNRNYADYSRQYVANSDKIDVLHF